jgi:bacterioferritin-associated ferredoxin
MYVCVCNALRDHEVRTQAAAASCCTVSMIYRSLGAKPECGKCVALVREPLRQAVQIPQTEPAGAAAL